jgi:hypothetical protein
MTAPPAGSLALLRHRGFRLLFIGQGVSVLGNRMVDVALAFAVLELGGSTSEVGSCSPPAGCRRSRPCWRAG